MPAGPLQINSVDVSTLGFRLASAPGWLDLPGRTTPSIVRPTRAGAFLAGTIQEAARRLSLIGVVDGSTDVVARTNYDSLRALILKTQPAVIILPDNSTRFVSGFLEQLPVDPGNGPSMIQRTLRARMDFNLLDPYWYDVTATNIVGLAAAGPGTAMPLGTAPSYPVITSVFSGSVASHQITLWNSAGVAIGNYLITYPFVLNDVLIVDCDRKTITINGVSRLDTLTSGDFLVLDVASQGNYATSAWPGLSRTTNATVTVNYRKAWR